MRCQWLTRLVAVALIATASGCTSSSSQWAAEAQIWHAGLREAQIAEGGSVFARFLSPEVVWDHRANFVNHRDIHHGIAAISHADWALGPASLRMEPDIFISVDGLVWFYVYDYAPLGHDYLPETKAPQHGVSLMDPIGPFGAKVLVNGTAVDDWRESLPDWPHADEADAVATSWTRLWSGDADDPAMLYHEDAHLQDSISGVDVTGRDAIFDLAADAGTWEVTTVGAGAVRGVYPLVHQQSGTTVLEEVAVVVAGEDERGCRGEMVVWLVLDEGRVATETRYWPIDRARRCLPEDELPDGWWTDRAVPTTTVPPRTEDLDSETDPLVAGDDIITVYNGTANLNRLLAWGRGRFEAAGLTPPPIVSATFTLYSEFCDDIGARYRRTDGGGELTFCFGETLVCWDENCDHFRPDVRRLVLHELAHAWIDANLDEGAKQRFADHTGLAAWNDKSVVWDERAFEHAAETLAWGLIDRDLTMIQIGSPTTEQLAEDFGLLTGTDPLIKTDDFFPTFGAPQP